MAKIIQACQPPFLVFFVTLGKPVWPGDDLQLANSAKKQTPF